MYAATVNRGCRVLFGCLLVACSPAGPSAPEDPLAACVAAPASDPLLARDLVERQADARIAAAPLGEEGATALFGTSTPAAASLWRVVIDVKTLPPDTHFLLGPPRLVRSCAETVVGWEKIWPSTQQAIFPEPPAMSQTTARLLGVPPLFTVVPPPDMIQPDDSEHWDKLEEVTGKARPRKKKYKLTPADKQAWSDAEETRRSLAQKAHEQATAENARQAAAFAEEKAAYETALASARSARDALGRLGVVQCDPPQLIGEEQIVFRTAGRCEYITQARASEAPPGAPCTTADTFLVDAQWALSGTERAACIVDATTRLALGDGATPQLLGELFAEGPLPLKRLRGPR